MDNSDIRVCAYARVSSEEQQERGTIQNQIEFGEKYADLHGYKILKWYLDDGITGTIPLSERPGGKELLKDAEEGTFELLLVYKIDRLGRSARIILDSVYELEQYGVKIKSMTEPFDTGDPNGRFILTILAGVADLERETILERMWLGANKAAREGKWLGGIVPYGYRVNDDGYLEINNDPIPGFDVSEADVVSMIYRLTVEKGWSTIKIADYLNLLGIPPSYAIKSMTGKRKMNTAGVWRPSRIRNMIVNTTYKGIHVYGKRASRKRELIARNVPAIVSEEVWEKAQEVLKENQIEALRNTRRRYLLRGMIKCGICGLTYSGVAYKSTGRNRKGYYVCNGKHAYRGPTQGRCPSKNIPQEWIENLVWNTCVSFIENPGEALKELVKSTQETSTESLESELAMLQRALKDKDTEKQQILDLYRRKIIDLADVETQLGKISSEKQALEKQLKEVERQIAHRENVKNQNKSIEVLLTTLRERLKNPIDFETKREIVKTLVKEIVVETKFNGDIKLANVRIKYRFPQVNVQTPVGATEEKPDTPGGRIRLLRLTRGLTIEKLAEMTGLSSNTISKIEKGAHTPTITHLRAIAEALNSSVAYLGCFENLPESTWAEKVKKLRMMKGLTQQEFADMLGINVKTLRNWERGIKQPSVEYFRKVKAMMDSTD
ncbi:MAG: recombinase family protein [Thermacetogeniaceae bacterium]